MSARWLAIACLALVACAGDLAGADDDCSANLAYTPATPIEGAEIRVTANVSATGLPSYQWTVRHAGLDVPYTEANASGSEITFVATSAGTYTVVMTPSVPGAACASEDATINVQDATGDELDIRLHVTPPPGVAAPPFERPLLLVGATDYDAGLLPVDAGRMTTGTVGRAAYLRFMPDGQPEAIVETYTDASGAFAARVQNVAHTILVVPTDPAYPPQLISDTPGAGETYTLDAGAAISGVVRRPSGSALAGAKVQLFASDLTTASLADDNVPSTIATTAADGSFTLRTSAPIGEVRVVVIPPAGSGLPRLEATSDQLDLAQPLAIDYASTLATRNVGGTTVQRTGPLANARVTIVGTIANAGTISAGAAATALGVVRVAATTDSSGDLPSTVVPAASLYAVVATATPGDYAVATFDTTTGVPATIAAAQMTPFTTVAMRDTAPVPGVRLELEPAGPLALAGIGPTVLTADGNGQIAGVMATGGTYTARFSDPTRIAGARVVRDATPTTITAQTALPAAVSITGRLELQDNPIVGAAIEVLCNRDTCTGLERDRALGESASDSLGEFRVSVPKTP